MIKAVRILYLRFLVAWVDAVRRSALWVVLAAVVATGASLFYTVDGLGINTSTSDMLSKELPFRQIKERFKSAFPKLRNNIVIVLDGNIPDRVEDASMALAERLQVETEVFNFILDLANDPFFRKNGLLYLDVEELSDLSDRLADAEPLLATLSEDRNLRGFFEVLSLAAEEVADGEAEPGRLEDVFRSVTETIQEQQAGGSRPMSWRKMMKGGDVDPDDLRHFILAQPKLDYSGLNPAAGAIDTIRAAARELELDPEHGIRVRLTGGVVLEQEELQSVFKGASMAGVLSFVLVGWLVMIGLRSWRLVLVTLVTLCVGLVWSLAYATFSVGQLNLISVAFAVLFIGIGVDFGIQFCLRYREEIGRGLAHEDALRETVAGIGGALTLAAVVAAIGFFSFVPTSYVGLSELGIIAGGSMFIALFANLTVLPAVLSLIPFKLGAVVAQREHVGWLETSSVFFIRHAEAVALTALVVGVICAVVFLPRLHFDFDPMHLKDPTTESVQTAMDLMEDGDASFYSIAVLTENIEKAQALAGQLEELPQVDHTVTLMDYVPEDQEDKLFIIDEMALYLFPVFEISEMKTSPDNDDRRASIAEFRKNLGRLIYFLPEGPLFFEARDLSDALDRYGDSDDIGQADLEALEELLLAALPNRLDRLRQSLEAKEVVLAGLPEDLRQRNITADGRALVEVFPVENLVDNEALRRFVTAVRTIAPEATDNPIDLLEGGIAVTTAFKQAGILSLVIISLLLLIVLRSLTDTLLVLMPLFLAAILTAAATVMFNISLNFANIIAIPLLLSLGIAYGIYIVLRERDASSIKEVISTSTPRAILFSALTTMCSFGSLAISSHLGIASMGQLLAISLTFALVCTLIVLPALLACRARFFPRGTGFAKGKDGER